MLHSVRRGCISTSKVPWFICVFSLVFSALSSGCVEQEAPAFTAPPAEGAAPDEGAPSAEDLAKRDEALSLFDFWNRCPSPNDCEWREPEIEHKRSLVVTDPAILKRFSFERVMDQIVATSDDPSKTSLRLYQEWWDTQNSSETAVFEDPDVQHCDDEIDAQGDPALNGYKQECPRPEGVLAATNPFKQFVKNEEGERVRNPDSYMTIGLFNRMDVAPMDGEHCGEFRIVFAKRSGLITEDPLGSFSTGGDRNLLIFEGVLPNPNKQCGVNACLPVARFWKLMSEIRSSRIRGALLEQFYFRGLGEFEPVVKADHYGPKGGHIRTNQFMQVYSLPPRDPATEEDPNGTFVDFSPWQMRDFKLTKDCEKVRRNWGWWSWYEEECDLNIRQVPVGVNPQGSLFAAPSTLPEHLQDDARAFQDYLVTQVENLVIPDLKRFFYVDTEAFAAAQSTEPITQCFAELDRAGEGFARTSDHCYDAWFMGNAEYGDTGPDLDPGNQIKNFPFNEDLHARLQSKLDELNATDVEPIDIVRRLDTLSCAGCHQNEQGVEMGQGVFMPLKAPGDDPTVGELPVPPPRGGVAFREWDFVHISERLRDDKGHFEISPALKDRYLPFREEVMRDFLCEGDKIHADAQNAGPTLGSGDDPDSETRESGLHQSGADGGTDPRFETLRGPKRTH